MSHELTPSTPEEALAHNPWEGPVEPLRPNEPTTEAEMTNASPNKFHERGSQATERLGNMLADATEGPREAAKAKLKKIGRGALAAVRNTLRVAGYAPLTALGAGIAGAESYITTAKSNVNTIANVAESAKALTGDFIDKKGDDIRVTFENNRDTIKDAPNKVMRGLGSIALGFQNFRRNRQESTIAKQESRLAKSKEKLGGINQSIDTSIENQDARKRNSVEVRTEAQRKRRAAEAREEERRKQRAQFIEMGQSA